MLDLFHDKIVERVSEAKRKPSQLKKGTQRSQAPARPVRRERTSACARQHVGAEKGCDVI